MKKEISAGIISYTLKNQRPLYLILHYKHGHWDFAKGKLEPGETLMAAAERELFEETKTNAMVHSGFSFAYDYTFLDGKGEETHKIVVYFLGKAFSEDRVELSEEHLDFQWLSFEDALKRLTYDNSKSALNAAHQFLELR